MSGFSEYSGGMFGDGDSAEDRLSQEAEDLMRQGRYHDAAARYEELQRTAPMDVWAHLGYVSALECAGNIHEAANILEETAQKHRSNRHVQRFCRMFFERREDPIRARNAREELATPRFMLSDEPVDQLADLYFNQGRYHEAHGELRRLLQEESIPDDEPALLASINARIGACLRQEQRIDEARRHLLMALDLDEQNYWTLSELAECERAAQNYDKARAYYHRALAEHPTELGCRGHLAQLEQEQGNSEEAIRLYEGILADSPQSTWAMVELAQVLAELDPVRSRQLCENALREDPSFPWAYAQLGQLARRSGNLDEAHKYYTQALSTSPGAIWILHELADTCRQMGRVEEAVIHLQHANNSDPFDPTTHGYLGDCMRNAGKLKEARAHFAKAVELDPAYTWSWRELAEVRAMLGEHEQAEAAYASACKLEPDDAINDGLKAFLLRAKGEHEASIPHLRKAVQAAPQYAWARRELVESLMATNQLKEAEQEAKEALKELPHFGPIRLLLADAQRRLGHRTAALKEIESALKSEPDVPQLWAMRAELCSDSDPQRALAYAKRAASTDPAPEFQLLLAQILRLNGETEEARKLSRAMSREHPHLANGWLLLIELAEERGDKRSAEAAARLGTQHCPNDWRIILHLTRLEWQNDSGRGIDRLNAAFEQDPSTIPWREVAILLAQAKRNMECHRALAELIKHSPPDLAPEAWRTWCECEVHMGNHPAAIQAINKAIEYDPDSSANRLLAAALMEQVDDGQQANAHLEFLGKQLPAEGPYNDEQRFILRQLAISYARCERVEEAAESWDLLLQQSGDVSDHLGIHLEAIRFFRTAQQLDRAQSICETILEQATEQSLAEDQGNELLTEYGLVSYQHIGLQSAIDNLLVYDRHLRGTSQELLAQLFFAQGAHQQALDLVINLHQQTPTPLERIQIMELRCLMGLNRSQEAQRLAQDLLGQSPQNEQVAVLYAELLCHEGQGADALRVLQHPALPSTCGIERCLLHAICLLEFHGTEPALSFLGQQADCLRGATPLPPLLKVLHHAWPSVPTPQGTPDRCSLDDLRTFPLLLQAGSVCAQGLAQQGQHGLAGALCAALGESHLKRFGGAAGRRSWYQAAFHWCRTRHMRRKAWLAAWRSRSLIALCRCCLP